MLPPPRHPGIKKTLVFDLDETLIHCLDEEEEGGSYDFSVPIAFPGGESVDAHVNVRPYALECLREANEHYQVVVFTASHRNYADPILDYLDPCGDLVHFRLYREHCVQTAEGLYVKDLRVLANRDLKDVVIVDNAVHSFAF